MNSSSLVIVTWRLFVLQCPPRQLLLLALFIPLPLPPPPLPQQHWSPLVIPPPLWKAKPLWQTINRLLYRTNEPPARDHHFRGNWSCRETCWAMTIACIPPGAMLIFGGTSLASDAPSLSGETEVSLKFCAMKELQIGHTAWNYGRIFGCKHNLRWNSISEDGSASASWYATLFFRTRHV